MKLLKSVKKPYLLIDNKEDIIKVSKKVSCIIPIIKISNTTGEGLDLLKYLIYLLNPRGNYHEYFNSHDFCIFCQFCTFENIFIVRLKFKKEYTKYPKGHHGGSTPAFKTVS